MKQTEEDPLPPYRGNDDQMREPSKIVQIDIEPIWEDADSLSAYNQNHNSRDFYVFWDQSIPMGGYIHRTSQNDQLNLQRIHESLLNANILSNDEPGMVECRGITDVILPFDCDNRLLSRNFFNGIDSRLDKGVEDVIDALTNGYISHAAFITDLIATAEVGNQTVSGAHTLRQYFAPIKGLFNKGKFHVSLLGIHIDYWGVQSGACRNVSGPLGCWYHESDRRYKPMDNVVQRPIYILILGRSSDGDTRKDNSVNKFTQNLHELISDHDGFDTQFELITTGALGTHTDLEWNPHDDQKSARGPVILDPERGYSCNDRKTHTLKVNFINDAIVIDEIISENFDVFEPITEIQKEEQNGITLNLDCKSVVDKIRQDHGQRESEKICSDKATVKPSLTHNIHH